MPHLSAHALLTGSEPVGMITGHNSIYGNHPDGHTKLENDLKEAGLRYEHTVGRYGTKDPTLLVYGASKPTLYNLSKKYGQESFCYSDANHKALVYSNGPNDGKQNPYNGDHESWPEGSPEPAEDYWTKMPDHGYVRLHFNDELEDAGIPKPVNKHELGSKLLAVLRKTLGESNPVHEAARSYHQQTGIPHNNATHEMDEGVSRRAATAYEGGKHDPSHPAVAASYQALKNEVLGQYNHLKSLGYKFTPYGEEAGQFGPYKDHHDVTKDVLGSKHLHVYSGGSPPADHPLSEPLPGNDPLGTYNVAFRAVHDVFGHAQHGHDFTHQGEENAWLSHHRMFSPAAQPALATETRGQNAAFWYGHNGDANRLNPLAGKFPDQKAMILPQEFHTPRAMAQGGINKTEAVIFGTRSDNVADKKDLSLKDALKHVHEGLKKRVETFEKECLELRKAETARADRKPASMAKGMGTPGGSEAVSPSAPVSGTGGGGMSMSEMAKNAANPGAYGPGGGGMAPAKPLARAESCKLCGKGGCSCAKTEAYAKGEKKDKEDICPKCGDSKPCDSCGPEAANRRHGGPAFFDTDASALDKYAKGEPSPVARPRAKVSGPLPAGANVTSPGDKPGVTPDDKESKDLGGEEGSGGEIKKLPMKKAAMASGAAPAAPGAPKPAGGAGAAMPKIAGPSGDKKIKINAKVNDAGFKAAMSAPKTPPMGAGTPSAAKAEPGTGGGKKVPLAPLNPSTKPMKLPGMPEPAKKGELGKAALPPKGIGSIPDMISRTAGVPKGPAAGSAPLNPKEFSGKMHPGRAAVHDAISSEIAHKPVSSAGGIPLNPAQFAGKAPAKKAFPAFKAEKKPEAPKTPMEEAFEAKDKKPPAPQMDPRRKAASIRRSVMAFKAEKKPSK